MVFLALSHIYEQRTGFLSREPDFQEFPKKPQNMFSWCFLFDGIFRIIRHLSREPDFEKFLEMPQSVFSWCF